MRYSGETVDAALSKGLADLGVGRDQVEVTVISEGRKGFLGIEESRRKSRSRFSNPMIKLMISIQIN